jgi:hypothetical protein
LYIWLILQFASWFLNLDCIYQSWIPCFNIPFILSAAFSYGSEFLRHTWQYSVFYLECFGNHSHNIAILCLNDESMVFHFVLSLLYSHIKALTLLSVFMLSVIPYFLRIGICNNAQITRFFSFSDILYVNQTWSDYLSKVKIWFWCFLNDDEISFINDVLAVSIND